MKKALRRGLFLSLGTLESLFTSFTQAVHIWAKQLDVR